MQEHARVVIIGAGIVGCSAAYHLTKLGWKDIVVVDQGPLYETGGSTSHAPGIVFGTNPSQIMTRMAEYTVKLLPGRKFEGEPVWYPAGGLEVSTTPERQQELWRRYSTTRAYGAEAHMLSPREVHELVPLIDPQAILGGYYRPQDGVTKAWKAAGSLALEAIESGGAEFYGRTRATGIALKHGRVQAVVTDKGRIACEQVLLCTNIWGSVLADKVGVTLPFMACAHHYGVTEPLPELAGETRWAAWPPIRHQDRSAYYAQRQDTWWTGSYRHPPHMVSPYDVGTDAYYPFFEEEWQQTAVPDAEELFPALKGRAYRTKVNGMFVFSVDGMPMMGPTHVPGFWTAVGIWITHSGGAGKTIAEWMTTGRPEWDTREVDVRRFHAHQLTGHFIQTRSTQNYVEVYDIIHPKEQIEHPRNLRVSPWHGRQQAQAAEFFVSAGWEVAQWYRANAPLVEAYGIEPREGWAAQFWSPIEGGEARATRERVALYDISAFTKIEVSGRGALGYLQRLAANDVDRPVGKVVYTSLLDTNGGIRADLTITRVGADRYWILTGGRMGQLDLAWIQRHAPTDGSVQIHEFSSAYAVIGLWGPRARKVLAQVTSQDVTHAGFPYYTAKKLEVDAVPVLALRVSYVGELGWELYTPTEFGLHLWDRLWEAGQSEGIITAGGGAFDALRLEKGYRLWGAELHTEYNPLEAGLAWTVKPDKGDFIGREAFLQAKETDLRRKLCCLVLEPGGVALGKEAILDGETVLGYVTSANMGYNVGKFIAYGYLPIGYASEGTQVHIQYLDRRVRATVSREPLFDPGMAKIKC